MKLIGSITEQNFREELIKSHISLFQDKEKQRLLKILKVYYPKMKTAYVLGWTPEQGEDIFRILINTEIIVGVELDRINVESEPRIEEIKINSYKHGLSKNGQIKLAVAIDLAEKDLKYLINL